MITLDRDRLEDDGLATPEIGVWGQQKYKLVQGYCELFATSMKNRWENRVYIDLFAGAGRAKVKGCSQILDTSALRALDIPNQFTHYIFCDKNEDNLNALSHRVQQHDNTPDYSTTFIHGDANQSVGKIVASIPKPRKGNKVLAFCFVDPFKLGNLKFDTIDQLSRLFMDFLILIPTHMDAERNATQYYNSNSTKLDNFIGNDNWRREWSKVEYEQRFDRFMVEQFSRSMTGLDYLPTDVASTQLIRNTKNRGLYRLAFYSRSDLGTRFWKDVKRLSDPRIPLFA